MVGKGMGGRRKEEKKIYNEGSDVVMSSSISHAAQEFRRVQKQKVELTRKGQIQEVSL